MPAYYNVYRDDRSGPLQYDTRAEADDRVRRDASHGVGSYIVERDEDGTVWREVGPSWPAWLRRRCEVDAGLREDDGEDDEYERHMGRRW